MNYKEVKIEIRFMIPDYLSLTFIREKVRSFVKMLTHFDECKKFSFDILTKEEDEWRPFP